jgi:hypothetical protein
MYLVVIYSLYLNWAKGICLCVVWLPKDVNYTEKCFVIFSILYGPVPLFICLSQWDDISKDIVSMDSGKTQQPKYLWRRRSLWRSLFSEGFLVLDLVKLSFVFNVVKNKSLQLSSCNVGISSKQLLSLMRRVKLSKTRNKLIMSRGKVWWEMQCIEKDIKLYTFICCRLNHPVSTSKHITFSAWIIRKWTNVSERVWQIAGRPTVLVLEWRKWEKKMDGSE